MLSAMGNIKNTYPIVLNWKRRTVAYLTPYIPCRSFPHWIGSLIFLLKKKTKPWFLNYMFASAESLNLWQRSRQQQQQQKLSLINKCPVYTGAAVLAKCAPRKVHILGGRCVVLDEVETESRLSACRAGVQTSKVMSAQCIVERFTRNRAESGFYGSFKC